MYTLDHGGGGYLAFLGRMTPDKRVDRAIAIAKRVGMPLRIAAKFDSAYRTYFESEVEPFIDGSSVEYLGEIGEDQKQEFLGSAEALLFPIDWQEPFGMAMIESMACGTPVVAFEGGAVREVIDEGVSGFVVHSVDEAVAATRKAVQIDRHECRASFERRFTAQRMADEYLSVYCDRIEQHARSIQ
jgi:glycosyltransferase involved in cell wall biosynthesis